ncbi:MAG: TRAM domain-containing protein [Candidatus Micrarchaeota archaeon]|nr:TRAM domain-containing protein [Candidatus Micrarchaeota archaeon]
MGFGRGGGSDMPKPVKVGEELEVTIEAVAAKGDGIAKKDGFVIFVPGTAVGQKLMIRITAVKPSCAVAEKADGASAPAESEVPPEEPAA